MKKKIIIIVAILLALLLTADIIGANYLVDFSIARKNGTEKSVAPTPATADDAQQTISENTDIIHEQMEAWLETVDITTRNITSADGLSLVADYIETDPESHKYAILVHGYSGKRSGMRAFGMYYSAKGYNLLLPDLRAHGDSEGDYIGMGWLDKDDMLLWIDQIILQDPEAQIVLHGVSMGGATVLMTSGEELPDNVKVIVDDCGYTSVWDIFEDELAYLFHLPSFPLLNTASVIAGFRAGYSFTEASSLEQVKKTNIPIFFTHGSVDNFVHTEMVYDLYEACPTDKELYIVEGAGHGNAMYMDPDLYFDKVFAFIDRFVE